MVTDPSAPKEYALRLREAAGRAGIYSARELARLLDVQEQTVKQWYGGNARPNGKNLTNLLAILHVERDWLTQGTTVPKKRSAPKQVLDPSDDFRAALAVIRGMGSLLSDRNQEVTSSDANKIGRTVIKTNT